MHERHVKLMREMDENYKLIEQETQDYYIEFLQKWKEVAKSKITQYRKAIEQLALERDLVARSKDQVIDNLNDRFTSLLREKEKLVREYNDDIVMRESTIEQLKISHSQKLSKKEDEKR